MVWYIGSMNIGSHNGFMVALVLLWYCFSLGSSYETTCKRFQSGKQRHNQWIAKESFKGSIFPMPKVFVAEQRMPNSFSFVLSDTIQLSISPTSSNNRVIELAIDRWCERSNALYSTEDPEEAQKFRIINSITITVGVIPFVDPAICNSRHCRDSGNHASDRESYRIDIRQNSSNVQIFAKSTKGVLTSLTVLSQLLFVPLAGANSVTLFDWPDRKWRGENYFVIGIIFIPNIIL